MKVEDLQIGDVVFAAYDIIDDGSMPDGEEGDMLAPAGTRGVVVMLGHLEEMPNKDVILVRFEDQALNLGQPIGCFTEDLLLDQAAS